jgi:nascent polypeptide-associated complex subunit alpha
MFFDLKRMEGMMRQLGIKSEHLDTEEIVIKLKDRELVFKKPFVTKINAQGQEIFQVAGPYEEHSVSTKEEIELVAQKAKVSLEEAEKALKKYKDVAEAILNLKK